MSPACMKGLLLLFNVVFWITGLIILVLGVWVKQELYKFMSISTESNSSSPDYLIIIGSCILIIGFAGCFCIMKGPKCFLYVYASIMIMVFFVEFGGGMAIFIYRAKLMGGFDQGLNQAMDSYKKNATNDTTVMDFNFIQKTLHCCGKKGPDDWKGISVSIPEACCIQKDCNVANKDEVFKDGCYAKVIKFLDANIGMVAGIAIGVAFFPLIGVLLSCAAAGGCSFTSCGWGVSVMKKSVYERMK